MNNVKENLEVLFDVMKDYKKTTIVLVLSLFLTTFVAYHRVPGWWNTVVVSYELDKPTAFRWLTNKCVVNVGTEVNEDWVPCDRIFGAGGVDGDIGE